MDDGITVISKRMRLVPSIRSTSCIPLLWEICSGTPQASEDGVQLHEENIQSCSISIVRV